MIERVMLVSKFRLQMQNRDCPVDRIPQDTCEHAELRRVVFDGQTYPVLGAHGEGPAWIDTERRHVVTAPSAPEASASSQDS